MRKSSWYASTVVTIALVTLVALSSFPRAQNPNQVDLKLVLAIDCSYSVDAGEYALQMAGMAAAFIDPEIVAAIESGAYGAIAVTVVQWSHPSSQIIVVPWTRVASGQEALTLAAAIAKAPRQTSEGATSISGMLTFGHALLRASPYSANRDVIDIVADGENNSGERVEFVRDRLNAQGITINALAIHNEVSYLKFYMHNRVIGGGYSFVEPADDYSDFGRAIHKKLLREVQGIPIG